MYHLGNLAEVGAKGGLDICVRAQHAQGGLNILNFNILKGDSTYSTYSTSTYSGFAFELNILRGDKSSSHLASCL